MDHLPVLGLVLDVLPPTGQWHAAAAPRADPSPHPGCCPPGHPTPSRTIATVSSSRVLRDTQPFCDAGVAQPLRSECPNLPPPIQHSSGLVPGLGASEASFVGVLISHSADFCPSNCVPAWRGEPRYLHPRPPHFTTAEHSPDPVTGTGGESSPFPYRGCIVMMIMSR